MNLKNLSPRKAKAKIKEWPVTFGSNGLKLTGKVLLPEGASADSPVPGAVLCHGFGGSHRFMKSSAKILTEQGIATLIFDFRGHGASGGAVDGKQADDAVDAWNALKQFPEVDRNRMGIIGHSLGAMSAVLAAGKVDSPRALVALSCPPIIDDEMFANAPKDFGQWGRRDNHIFEFPRHGALPWMTGISAFIARIFMFATRRFVRVDIKRFIEGMLQANMAEVVAQLDNCAKLFVFCEGDTVTPYQKSVLVYEAACEPRLKLLARGNHSTPIMRGNLRSQWTTWAVSALRD